MSLNDSDTTWEKLYGRRQPKLYIAEDKQRICYQPTDKQGLIESFIDERRTTHLQPSPVFTFNSLRQFLELGDIAVIENSPIPATLPKDIVLLDERKDTTGNQLSVRLWDSEDNPGYLNYPPRGEIKVSKAMSIQEFAQTLRGQRLDRGAERRTIYVANITPDCALAFAATVPCRTAPFLRAFLQNNLRCRASFSVTKGLLFALEFHIPFYALRRGNRILDSRGPRGFALRSSQPLPLARNNVEKTDIYYECQISMLLVGVDEWLWTSYCCVDTYFGTEPNQRTYLDQPNPIEPATGGASRLEFPKWNPREFFLITLSRRIMQATGEWIALIEAFEERMNAYEANTLFDFIDDQTLSRTTELTLAVSTLRRFRDTLSRILEAWQYFEQYEMQNFYLAEPGVLQGRWRDWISSTRGHIRELRSCHSLLSQKLELFNSMKDGMVNVSALKESAAATSQGNFIKVLTLMTVCYLPLGLSTGIFSMVILPEGIHWTWFLVVLACLILVTAVVAAFEKISKYLNWVASRKW